MSDGGGERRAQRWLVAGMIAGLAAAAASLLQPGAGLPDGAVARVNDQLITREAWLRAVATVAGERRTPLTAADQRVILERLVDEELLLQHGLAMGLVEHDRRLRNQLVAQVVAAAGTHVTEPDDAVLRAYYARNQDYFATPARLRVAARQADGAPVSPPVPDALLPPAKLREYLGPRLTDVALTLQPGEVRATESGVTLEIVEKEPAVVPPFEAVRDEVLSRWRREAEADAIRTLLRELREDGNVVIGPTE